MLAAAEWERTQAEKQSKSNDYLFFLQGVYLQSPILAVWAVVLVIVAELRMRLRRLAFLPLIRWPPPVRFRLTLPDAVTLTLLVKPLWVFCLGI